MTGERPRVLLDTNICLSYAISTKNRTGTIDTIFDALIGGDFTLLIAEQLLDEIYETIKTKPYFTDRITRARASEFISELRALSEELVLLAGPFPALTRDSKDDYLLAYAMAGSADYLVSGDKDLLALGDALAPLKIRSPQTFVDELEHLRKGDS